MGRFSLCGREFLVVRREDLDLKDLLGGQKQTPPVISLPDSGVPIRTGRSEGLALVVEHGPRQKPLLAVAVGHFGLHERPAFFTSSAHGHQTSRSLIDIPTHAQVTDGQFVPPANEGKIARDLIDATPFVLIDVGARELAVDIVALALRRIESRAADGAERIGERLFIQGFRICDVGDGLGGAKAE